MGTPNILLTGCTSFLGRNFLEYSKLPYSDAKIFCITRKLPNLKYSPHNIIFQLTPEPDNMPIEQMRSFIEKNHIGTIVHCASLVGEGKGSWRNYFEVNVKWTLNLANAFMIANVDRCVFIHISTVGVHGTIPLRIPANELTPYAPDGYYHLSKMLAEKELIKLRSRTEFPLVILRPTIMYGKYDQGFLWKLLKISRKFVLPIRLNIRIHLVDVKCMVGVIDDCLLNRLESGIFIVGDRENVELRRLLLFLNNRIGQIRYLEIQDKTMQLVERLAVPLKKYANIKLLCRSWYYDVNKIKSNLSSELGSTYNAMENYIWWYKKTL